MEPIMPLEEWVSADFTTVKKLGKETLGSMGSGIVIRRLHNGEVGSKPWATQTTTQTTEPRQQDSAVHLHAPPNPPRSGTSIRIRDCGTRIILVHLQILPTKSISPRLMLHSDQATKGIFSRHSCQTAQRVAAPPLCCHPLSGLHLLEHAR